MQISSKKYTIMAVLFGLISIFMARQWDYDLWEIVANALNAFDLLIGHELIFVLFFVVFGVALDNHGRRKHHRQLRELSKERIDVMKATMTTVNDIVNNALNSLQLFRLEAQKNAVFPPDSIRQFDEIIFDTTNRLKDIHERDDYVSYTIAEGLTGIREN